MAGKKFLDEFYKHIAYFNPYNTTKDTDDPRYNFMFKNKMKELGISSGYEGFAKFFTASFNQTIYQQFFAAQKSLDTAGNTSFVKLSR